MGELSRQFVRYCDWLLQAECQVPIGWAESAKPKHISISFRVKAIARVS
jgi:hypothetical protein